MVWRLLGGIALALAIAGCSDSSSNRSDRDVDRIVDPDELADQDRDTGDGKDPDYRYNVEVTRTQYGVPHIRANDWGSLGYGYGYAQAEDNLCVVLEDLITVAGERARSFGRDGSYRIQPNGSVAGNVDSDFFWRMKASAARIEQMRNNAEPEIVAGSWGYADGFSRYVREIQQGQHPGRHEACRDAHWLREITEEDMYRRYFRLGLLASSSVFVSEIANTRPLGLIDDVVGLLPGGLDDLVGGLLEGLGGSLLQLPEVKASNMYAFGPEAVEEGQQPLLFGNPHFPWIGTERLYKAQLTIPGELNIAGAGLYGVPLALIGYNEHVAWSHTVSTAYRFTLYQLKLVPGRPTAYFYDGKIREMEAIPLEIEVLEADGSFSTEQRTLYRSHYGPMLHLSVDGIPILPWNGVTAYTLRDANAENDRMMNQFLKWNQASSLDQFIDLHGSVLGVPWVNTVATGPDGRVYYGDVTVVPNVPDSKVRSCAAQPLASVLSLVEPGLPLLDGSRSSCEWDDDPDAPAPGIFGPANLPSLVRDDWVHNCNDSHWLSNPEEPLTGYARIIGDEGGARTLRTRLCMQHVQRRLDGSDGRPGNRFDRETLKEVVLDSHILSAGLARDSLLGSACLLGYVLTERGPVNVREACNVLANWDLSANLDSVGAHIWREFWREVGGANLPVWATPFRSSDPVNTPRNLLSLNPEIHAAFGRAVRRIQDAGIPLDAELGSVQRSGIHPDRHIPVFGGEHFEGAFTIATGGALAEDGYRVTNGNSYIQIVSWERQGKGFRPVADGFITYSQSTDPASPYFLDFTEAYSRKAWHRFPFTPDEVKRNAVEQLRLVD